MILGARPAGALVALGLLAGCSGQGPATASWAPAPGVDRLKELGGRQLKPDDLVGLSARDLNRLLGDPTLAKNEAPAEVLQYSGADCVLLVFLYPDTGREPTTVVTHAVALTRAKSQPASPDCVDSLIKRSAKVGS